ncbi:hypothetical protein AIOL_002192 [Candidatus Rhodobacter oscarellae]|uniref:Uncharacterized protein n=1 Tax=Candidatus Rhodobacter oscarellae TaxID=1675527 RepID=A0A0J9E2Z5_9RHOB|nr:hypothetical protein AIOL_002192 [Candidatus Rhodobacter lobularis]
MADASATGICAEAQVIAAAAEVPKIARNKCRNGTLLLYCAKGPERAAKQNTVTPELIYRRNRI